MQSRSNEIRPWVRVVVLVSSLVILLTITLFYTGEVFPTNNIEFALVVGTLLFVVLGTMLLERYFTTPGEAFVNTLGALLVVVPLRGVGNDLAWLVILSYLVFVGSAAFISLVLQTGEARRRPKWVHALQAFCFRVSSSLGKTRVVYSSVFVVVVAFFAPPNAAFALALSVFWALLLMMWAIRFPQWLSRIDTSDARRATTIGYVDRVDSPNLVRVRLNSRELWDTAPELPVRVTFTDLKSRWGVRLFADYRADGEWATVLLGKSNPNRSAGRSAGLVELPAQADVDVPTLDTVMENLKPSESATLVGVVREHSSSREIRVELLPTAPVIIGQVLTAQSPSAPLLYQVLDAETSEETFGSLQYGSHIARAVAIGSLQNGRLERVDWVPKIGSPMFVVLESGSQREDVEGILLGRVPGTGHWLSGDFVGQLESHTAILGTTGSGKTELAFDMIRHALKNGVKVVCIDLTSQYSPRLADLMPAQLTISDQQARDLGQKLFDVETGTYGAPNEKRVLNEFATVVRGEVETSLRAFLSNPDVSLGLIELREISNTKATLWITEMFLSTLLAIARRTPLTQKVLVVVEEAHTVMPEASFLGLGDFDSKGTVAKITQIALQGRKYGVGLLVLAQRTATVSKSVLTQCNTVISFSCIDDTSIGFLRNVYGSAVAETLPNLPPLRAVAHGPWVNSGMPVMFDVPFDEEKASRSPWVAQLGSASAYAAGSSSTAGAVQPSSSVTSPAEAPF